ncbi:hypothetical protein ACFZBM_19870 [Streptomyces lavendulae]|uniref:Uncharacterized protein n=1 Tax=Streptomyces lavendulae subsp. lavendulae TaxID=58340 RepID=A0A2K8PMG3_STRLA|nr:hypothetical protein SLAV_30720 [Streptomyces lavendulae subsp. lavendulae]QUQ57748.1 hypothetical protein SLLC_28880 [Streptomyces lavendulae subsp. lavendulae]
MRMYEEDGAATRMPGRGLWVEEPARRRRMPDPVRASAVRALLIVAVTLTEATITFFLAVTGSWLAFPMVICGIAGTVVATWAVLDVWITRQMWNQRGGVVSQPSSAAREARAARSPGLPGRGVGDPRGATPRPR